MVISDSEYQNCFLPFIILFLGISSYSRECIADVTVTHHTGIDLLV
jgi:hypothetical protein